MARRIQRKRTTGWRMPEGAVYVGRPSKWGNPFVAHSDRSDRYPNGYPMSPEVVVQLFRKNAEEDGAWFPQPLPWPKGKIPARMTTIEDVRRELHGKDLACWCPLDQPCHADVLLEWANAQYPTP